MSASSKAEGSKPEVPTKIRWSSEENTFLWEEARKGTKFQVIADKLGRTEASVSSHYRALFRRNKSLAQHACRREKHFASEEREDCCTVPECRNYVGKWRRQRRA